MCDFDSEDEDEASMFGTSPSGAMQPPALVAEDSPLAEEASPSLPCPAVPGGCDVEPGSDGDSRSGGSDLFGHDCGGVQVQESGDVMEKCMQVLNTTLMRHWHLREQGRMVPLGQLVSGSEVVHVLDEEEWVNALYELNDEARVYTDWLLRFRWKGGAASARLSASLRQGLAEDFGGELECLVRGSSSEGEGDDEEEEEARTVRVRFVVGTYGCTLAALDNILRLLALHQLGLPRILPLGLPPAAITKARAALCPRPSVFFRGASPDSSAEALERLFGEVAVVSRLLPAFLEGGRLAGHGTCEFPTAAKATLAVVALHGKQFGPATLHVRRRF